MRLEADPPEADIVAIVDYLDGSLSEDEAIAFEERLGEEPELAAAFESFAQMDLLQRSLGARARSTSTPFLRMSALRFAAAAALLIGVTALFLWIRRPSGPSIRVAALPVATTLPDYNALLGLEPGRIPRGNGPRSEGGGGIGAREYMEEVKDAEQRRIEAAFASDREVRAGRYVVPFEASADVSVLVLGLTPGGEVRREYPRGPDVEHRFEGGRLHVLPRESVALTAESEANDRVELDHGFLVPLGVEELRVLLAYRDADFGTELLAELDEGIASWSAPEADAALRRWLDQHGFQVRELRVQAP